MSKKTLSTKTVIGEYLTSQSKESPILGGEFKKYSETMMILNAAAAPILGGRGHVQFASQEGNHGNFGWMEARARKNTRSYRDSKRSKNGILVTNHTGAHLEVRKEYYDLLFNNEVFYLQLEILH